MYAVIIHTRVKAGDFEERYPDRLVDCASERTDSRSPRRNDTFLARSRPFIYRLGERVYLSPRSWEAAAAAAASSSGVHL